MSKRYFPTECQRDENIFRTVLLKAASHHIPNGRNRLHEEPVPAEILDVMTRRDDLRKRDPTSHELPRLNYDIQNRIYAHKRKKMEILLRPWTRTQMSPSCGEPLKELMAEQKVRQRTYNYLQWKLVLIVQAACSQVQPTVNTSNLGRHTSSSETQLVNKRDKEDIIGDVTDIHHGSSEESDQEL